jgi:DNA mismatch repair protein MutS2
MDNYTTLEFDKILAQLAEQALSEAAKNRSLALVPSLSESEVRRRIEETTQARRIIEQVGLPPLASMTELGRVINLIAVDAMLMPEQIEQVSTFLASCRRMKAYLHKAESTGAEMAWIGASIDELPDLQYEIERCIRNGTVDDRASPRLADIRRQILITNDQIKSRLEALLRKNKAWFSEHFIAVRSGRYTLPVKREHKKDVTGTVIEMSNTGSTCFIEPASVARLQAELNQLQIEEDSEVRRILYALTALISDNLQAIKLNMEAMETLDFLFAKGKLSMAMKAAPVKINTNRQICIANARHPLLDQDIAVPLDFVCGYEYKGVVITGPNTGGKTVALKTVGLLSLMAQSGLHVPAEANSDFCLNNLIMCDIGDGQSITENLSTFSSHMKNIIAILKQADEESLVLLDELGSGTDPAEGMGLAVAILDELIARDCLFVVTTHYPEIKEYAAMKPGLVNACMTFDKESLKPLYRLEIGEAGESCALHIAERLGLPRQMLQRAYQVAYGNNSQPFGSTVPQDSPPPRQAGSSPKIIKEAESKPDKPLHRDSFNIGDSVWVYPRKEIGIVYALANEKGEIGVQIKGRKKLVNHKRIKLFVPASELYPENYDFSIVFDTVANRKARHLMGKRHVEGNIVIIKEDNHEK